MGVVMGVTAVVLEIAAALVGLMTWTALMFPRPTARARAVLEARPGRCFLIGLFLASLGGLPALGLLRAPSGLAKLAGWALAFPVVLVLALGLAAMAQLLGERLRALSPSLTPLGALVRGAITLELAAALPFLGWFLFAPLVGLTLLGAGALGGVATVLPRRHEEHQGEPEESRQEAVPAWLSSLLLSLASLFALPMSLCVLRVFVVHCS